MVAPSEEKGHLLNTSVGQVYTVPTEDSQATSSSQAEVSKHGL